MPANTNSIDIFIPVLNESRIIKNNILKVYSIFVKSNYDYQIYVIDDGSDDETPRVVKKLVNKKIHYIRFQNGHTRRENLFKAMNENGNSNIVCFIDIARIDPKYILTLADKMNEYDVIAGSRYTKTLYIKRKIFRMLVSFFFNIFWLFIMRSKIKDGNCGLKLFKRKAFVDLYNWLDYDYGLERGWLADRMILKRAEKLNYNVGEFQVRWIDRNESSFSLKQELQIIQYMLKNFRKIFIELR